MLDLECIAFILTMGCAVFLLAIAWLVADIHELNEKIEKLEKEKSEFVRGSF